MSNFRSQILDITFNGSFPGVDTISLANDVMPGQWVLQEGSVTFSWQEKKGYGLDGASIVATGRELAKPVFIARFWNVADWTNFNDNFRSKYFSKAAYTLAALQTYAIGILHPELNKVGVMYVAPAEIPWFTNNGKGLWTGRVRFIEWRGAPVIAQESPDAALPTAHAPQPSSADNAAAGEAQEINEVKGGRG